jgi:YVTN family beta-propeller protein
MPNGYLAYRFAVSPYGKKLYVTSSDGTTTAGAVYVIGAVNNIFIATVPVENNRLGISVTPDGAKVYVVNQDSNNVSVFDTTSNTVTATVNVGNAPQNLGQFIGKTAPKITWSKPKDIVYGTALTTTQPNAISSVPGSFIYNPPAGTLLSAGQNQQLNTTFTPTDIANYTQTNATVLINVMQATPTITWKNPADMVYGTKLSSAQLDAISSVPGSFIYNPQAGTVLSTGMHTLTTSFKPKDTVDYTTASATASINVITPV